MISSIMRWSSWCSFRIRCMKIEYLAKSL